jgi:hypothetical protein
VPIISRAAINVKSAAITASIMLVTLIAEKDQIKGLYGPVSKAVNFDTRTILI